ncbi:SdrD B-like domain-containing protein [Erythrobacter insulae]|nr:SdrD B-like domain-containing protein [Erythrobacter insulae]
MLTSILPFLAIATPGLVMAAVVTNTASISAPDDVIEVNTADNTVQDSDTLLLSIAPSNDVAVDVNGTAGTPGVVNVFDGDTIGGLPADPTNSVVSLADGSTLPPGISFDPATGLVDVAPDTPAGDYGFDYVICQIDVPDNCETASVSINIVAPPAAVSGTVYLDADSDRVLGDGEVRLGGWIVEVWDNGTAVATVVTDANGFYEIPGLAAGTSYVITFRNPTTGVVYERISGVQLNDASTLPDQNLPIDPSGVVYDAVTRAPVSGAELTLVDSSGNPLPVDCFIDASQQNQVTDASGDYRFDIVPGAAAACPLGETQYVIEVAPPAGYSFISTIIAPQTGSLDPTGQGEPLRVDNVSTAPTSADPTYYLSFLLGTGDPDVINNHIPLDPFLSRGDLIVTKTSTKRNASTGDLVSYEITVRNEESFRRDDIDVIDVLPAGMTYVLGTASVNGVPADPEQTNGSRELVWRDQIIPANSTVRYNLTLIVGAGVTEGQAVNTGLAENNLGEPVSNRGTATVSITPSTIFDCSELIGQVYVDANGNGYQDEGERGMPSVRLATVKGELITTDEFGRYHIACAAVPDARIGSNYVLKLDEATLPEGWAMTTDNPRSIRLTRGKMGELNFGVALALQASMQFDARAFGRSGEILPEHLLKLQSFAAERDGSTIIRAIYLIDGTETRDQITSRITAIKTAIEAAFANGDSEASPVIQVHAVAQSEAGAQ